MTVAYGQEVKSLVLRLSGPIGVSMLQILWRYTATELGVVGVLESAILEVGGGGYCPALNFRACWPDEPFVYWLGPVVNASRFQVKEVMMEEEVVSRVLK